MSNKDDSASSSYTGIVSATGSLPPVTSNLSTATTSSNESNSTPGGSASSLEPRVNVDIRRDLHLLLSHHKNRAFFVKHRLSVIGGADRKSSNKIAHHSHIFVYRVYENEDGEKSYREVTNFGLFDQPSQSTPPLAVFKKSEEDSHYEDSPNYSPKPTPASPEEIYNAFYTACKASGTHYHIKSNNCQTFAKRFMKELGATRTQRWGLRTI